MSRFICNVKVKRDGKWQVVESDSLVPGDVIDSLSDGSEVEGESSSLETLPCDCVLLEGVSQNLIDSFSSTPLTDLSSLDLPYLITYLGRYRQRIDADWRIGSGSQIGSRCRDYEKRSL